MKFIVKILILTFAVYITSQILPGVYLSSDFFTLFKVAVLLGVVNSILKPILLFLTLPLTLVTFGVFALIINAVMVLLVDYMVDGFFIDGLLNAIFFSMILSIISSFLKTLEG